MSNFDLNKTYNGRIKGFRYSNEYAFITVDVADATTSLIIGKKPDYPMRELMVLKECSSIDFKCTDVKTVNGVDYPKLFIESINY
jgi:hypothetical protein